ncbi:type I-MYXAN CRISPR-associated protein Cas6/Cmx6 [Thiohalocapsa marina]|uniref:Type I-MYXAN CRISPR-associated protein Cas6/Cmx6 n=1 Tax=Thiohalocapsa marina TaxID=424902 RepID=A0A5M8FMJ0_9GAMM|nr:type I-MYXAN CRISPR-associated protein Cas6/Cmx6 [Thiohalocapsa marina]KAA6185959.1 type I-MYXAN CRISPR-associated protein Cas6/Cmx6 [Thiohalocapsa marina]
MFWQEDEAKTETPVPDDIVDVLFAVDCRSIPVDHAHALSAALLAAAPCLRKPGAGIHTIHVAGSQNGWERPDHNGDQQLHLSRRTRLCIRLPREDVAELREQLQGQTLDVGGSALRMGACKERLLSKETTLLARYVAGPAAAEEEHAFLQWVDAELTELGIKVRKALCGKATPLSTPSGPLQTRSLMLAGLTAEESILLQQLGLGPHREMGCGLFIPHKGIDSVHKSV